MNRKKLEKMFDEKINTYWYNAERYIEHNERLKKIFFETIIPEVIKSVIDNKNNKEEKNVIDLSYNIWRKDLFREIKQKAKSLYWITL